MGKTQAGWGCRGEEEGEERVFKWWEDAVTVQGRGQQSGEQRRQRGRETGAQSLALRPASSATLTRDRTSLSLSLLLRPGRRWVAGTSHLLGRRQLLCLLGWCQSHV